MNLEPKRTTLYLVFASEKGIYKLCKRLDSPGEQGATFKSSLASSDKRTTRNNPESALIPPQSRTAAPRRSMLMPPHSPTPKNSPLKFPFHVKQLVGESSDSRVCPFAACALAVCGVKAVKTLAPPGSCVSSRLTSNRRCRTDCGAEQPRPSRQGPAGSANQTPSHPGSPGVVRWAPRMREAILDSENVGNAQRDE